MSSSSSSTTPQPTAALPTSCATGVWHHLHHVEDEERRARRFSFGDTNVGLIVSNPDFHAQVVKTPVATSQVAPTILELLGIDPDALKSVRVELTPVLPGLTQ